MNNINVSEFKDILGNVKILKCQPEKKIKTCQQCLIKREFLGTCKPCGHEFCTKCLDDQYDFNILFTCPKCNIAIHEVEYL